jgi:hypothetical protein
MEGQAQELMSARQDAGNRLCWEPTKKINEDVEFPCLPEFVKLPVTYYLGQSYVQILQRVSWVQ